MNSYENNLKSTSKTLMQILRKSSSYEDFVSNLYAHNFDLEFQGKNLLFINIDSGRKYNLQSLNLHGAFNSFTRRVERLQKLNKFKEFFKNICSSDKEKRNKCINDFLSKSSKQNSSLQDVVNEIKKDTGNVLLQTDDIETLQRQTKFKAKLNLLKTKEKQKNLEKMR